MSIFKKAERTQAYLKAGFLGFPGSGKTFTATDTIIGLVQLLRERKLPEGDKPVFFLDTETGSDYVQHRFSEAGIELYTANTRAFSDLISAVDEAEKSGAALIIDSVTHFWKEFTESYAKKMGRKRGLQFQDWAFLKGSDGWGKFTDKYINSRLHIAMCGRAGFEYDYHTDDETGKRELEKTGIKMKAEAEMAYEPSLLILMERSMDIDTKKVLREAHVLKERFDVIDGRVFRNPTFNDFMPHIERLNLGGQHTGVDSSRNSEGMIPDPDYSGPKRKEQVEIVLDEIQSFLQRQGLSSRTNEGKQTLMELFVKVFGTESWKRIETKPLEELRSGYDAIRKQYNEEPVYFKPDTTEQQEADLDKVVGG